MMRLSGGSKRYSTLGMVILISISICSVSYVSGDDKTSAVSQFAKEVTNEKYKETATPLKPPVFRWDFSKANVVYAYSYEQEVRGKTDMGPALSGNSGDIGQELSGKGLMLIKSQGDGTAELVLKDVKMSLKMNIGGENEPKTMEQTIPPIVVQGIKDDGAGSFGNSSQDGLLKMIFPLPPKTLNVGDSVDVPAEMPFNAMGSLLQVKGRSHITLTRYVKIGKRTCAQLDVDTDISELKVPTELKGEYKCSAKGTSVFYFDVENRSFVSGVIALIMQFSIDAPMPQINIPQQDTPKMPERAKMSMINDNLIRVQLKE